MKKFLKCFALMALFLMGSVQSEASVTLTYDFMNFHPSATMRIDGGYAEVIDGKTYWGGTWGGLFGRKIAFDVPSFVSLRGDGGLCDFHDHQKMYVMNLCAGDKVTFHYSGVNAALQYHVSSSCTVQGLSANFDPIASETTYTVTSPGHLCVLNKWKNNEAITTIKRIVIETAKDYENIDISDGLATFCSPYPLDFSSVTSVKAFIVTGYDNGKFTFKQVEYVPSNTGFLVVAQGTAATSVTVPIGRSANYRDNYISGNKFIGCLQQKSIPVSDSDTQKYYVFGKAYGYIGVYLMWRSFTCKANKAYIAIDK